MIEIDVTLEDWSGSPVIRTVRPGYARIPAAAYTDLPARLTPRQAVFCRNLVRLAEVLGERSLPVDFRLASGAALHLDRGCVKIAEHAGFIEPLANDASGVVSSIRLAWRV